MGFYGNITNTSKTTFSFDLIYTTRSDMDLNSNIDGVFLGRYVLVDYGEDPIKGYYDPVSKKFYNTALYSPTTLITGKEGMIYQDLHNALAGNSFYSYSEKKGFEPITTNSPYQERFSTDVKAYGRGYDSTAWVKRYDTASKSYKYVMVAELNAVVPTFHMVVNPPNAIPVTPYFDRDTTNIDYYLHMQSDYGNRIKKAESNIKSDEEVTRNLAQWVEDSQGYQSYIPKTETVAADIYYNNAGFDHKTRTFMDQNAVSCTMTNDKGEALHTKLIDYTKNQIGYEMNQSGRLYGKDADLGVYTEGVIADDIYDWFIRLPGIGNAICKMWDKIYDDRGNYTTRALNKALKRDDTDDHLVTYNKETLMGMINTCQDLIGYHFIPYEKAPNETITNANTTIMLGFTPENGVEPYTAEYYALACLYYKRSKNGALTYYHYAYKPFYSSVEPETVKKNPSSTFYYKEVIPLENDKVKEIYHVANPGLALAKNADGVSVAPTTYYMRHNQWVLSRLNYDQYDSLYTMLVEIHRLLGTNADDVRNIENVRGSINIMKDIIANIDTELAPGKLLHTRADDGVIDTTETYFPSATWDRDEVLDGDGNWVSRFASVTVLKNSTNANGKAPEVNVISNGTEAADATVLVSDNDKTNDKDDPTKLVVKKLHTPNNLTMGTRNKWIEMHPNQEKDSIEFQHAISPVTTRLHSQSKDDATLDMYTLVDENHNAVLNDATGYLNFKLDSNGTEISVMPTTDKLNYLSTSEDKNDNRLTIPGFTVDNAGHIVSIHTRNFNIPHSFKKIKTTTTADTVENASSDTAGVSIAENIVDTLTLTPQNRWIDIATVANNTASGEEEDQITFGHKLVPTLNDSVTLNGTRRTDSSKIPTVHRYGLPQNKTVANLDEAYNGGSGTAHEAANTFNVPYIEVDQAGHIVAAETHTVQLPENYDTIIIDEASTSLSNEYASGVTTKDAGATTDELAGSPTLTAKTLTETLTFKASNKWIRLNGTNTKGSDTITIGHEIHNIHPTTSSEDMDTTTNDKFTTQVVTWDNAGHIIGHDTKTWTLPDSFHNVAIVGNSTATTDASIKNGTLVAENSFDTFKISPSNRWIKLAANVNEDSFTIGHEQTPLVSEAADTETATKQKKFYTTAVPALETVQTDNEIIIPAFEIDNAGHVVVNTTTSFYIPHNFKSIAVVTDGDVDKDSEQKDDTIVADNIVDTWTLAPQNKWIDIAADLNADKITIGHKYSTQLAHVFMNDVEIATALNGTSQKDNKFIFPMVETDNAGHITGYSTNTLYVPHTFKTMKIAKQSTVDTAVTSSSADANIVADNIVDTFTIATGNKWVQTTSDTTNDKVTFSHILSGITKGTYGENKTFANFGGSISLYGYTVDSAGHITAAPTYTITLPTGSYTNKASTDAANVITKMEFDASSGAITTSSQNVGTMVLTGYTKLSSTAKAAITASSTINGAFAALDNRIETEEEARAKAISDEQAARDTAVSTERDARVKAIDDLRMFKTVQLGSTSIVADSNNDTLNLNAGNAAIVLALTESSDTISISHKTYTAKTNGLYKITVDEWGHVSGTVAAGKGDVGLGKVENKSVEEIVAEITSRFSLTLGAPVLTATTNNATFSVGISNQDAQSTYIYKWTKGSNTASLGAGSSYTATDTTPGTYTYKCTVTREYAGVTSTANKSFTYTVEAVTEPENGEEGTV